jgi:Carboxypeptidase regulatory-like domain
MTRRFDASVLVMTRISLLVVLVSALATAQSITRAITQSSTQSSAQSGTQSSTQSSGVLVGLITTGSGEAVRNTRIVLVETATGVRREATTDELGIYAFSLLPPGGYRIEPLHGGFVPRSRNTVVLKPEEKRSWRLVWDPIETD